MKFVIIQSQKDITVTKSIKGVDRTNYNSHTGNNLNVAPVWTKNVVDIRVGQHRYPVDILDWPSVKMLEEKRVITVGKIVDDAEEKEEAAAKEFEEATATVEALLEDEVQKTRKRRKKSIESSEEQVEE